jgi:hypothetical protein
VHCHQRSIAEARWQYWSIHEFIVGVEDRAEEEHIIEEVEIFRFLPPLTGEVGYILLRSASPDPFQ